jgi:uncharacterized RDD family membrane protein YckC
MILYINSFIVVSFLVVGDKMNFHIDDINFGSNSSVIIKRIVATIIDFVFLAKLIDYLSTFQGFYDKKFIIALVVSSLYYFILEGLTGYTLGKFILRIKAVNNDGFAPGLLKSLIRTLLRIVEVNPIVMGGFIAVIVSSNSSRKQRIGDMAAGTYVISLKDLKKFFYEKNEYLYNSNKETYENLQQLGVATPQFSSGANTFFDIEREKYTNSEALQHALYKSKRNSLLVTGALLLLLGVTVFSGIIYSSYNSTESDFKGKTVKGKSKTMEITLPYDFINEPEEDYEINSENTNIGIAVARIEKEEYIDSLSLLECCESKFEDLSLNMKNGKGTEFKNLIISGHPAVQFEFSGIEGFYKVSYSFTIIETKDDFYQVCGWTSQKVFNENIDTINSIARSFRMINEKNSQFAQKYPNQKGNIID